MLATPARCKVRCYDVVVNKSLPMPLPSFLRGARRALCALGVTLFASLPVASAAAGLVDAVEFYNATLDHYFVTAYPDEIGKLDNGFFVGWARTGQKFKVLDVGTVGAGLTPVCRFYGSPTAGLDSHFYSASPAECEDVRRKFAGIWLPESDNVFEVYLPNTTTGACPAGSVPLYRSWNNRADSNHRYTTDLPTQQAMIAKGYVAEGYGPTPVVMCSPQTNPGAVPTCQLTASSNSPQVGTQATLTSTCTGNPTSFTWTNCASVTAACTASAGGAGPQVYTFVATNASGSSVPASITLNWTAPPPAEPAPVCTVSITAGSETPTVNGLVVLVASCSGTPTSYTWSGGCISATNLCLVRRAQAGGVTYGVTATNASGSGSAAVNVTWVATAAPPSGQCTQFPSALYSSIGTASTSVYSTFYGDPGGYAYNGAWAIRFTVPASAGNGQFGGLTAAEFNGPPTFREITVSRTACDFRATDVSGNNGPLGRANGTTATLAFITGAGSVSVPGLTPGQTYYLNLRNYSPQSGQITCSSSQQRCDAIATINLPH
jgi:hypothetical protein